MQTCGGCSAVRAFLRLIFSASLLTAIAPGLFAQDWQASLHDPAPGVFPAVRAMHATYRFGWRGITAAAADVDVTKPGNHVVLEGKVRTVDMVKTLWNFEAVHVATADATSLHPIAVKQTERVRSKQTLTSLAFDPQGVTSTRGKDSAKAKRLNMPNLFDLQTALLFVRSQPLQNGNSYRFVVFPAKDPYLITASVNRREKITIAPGTFDSIAIDVQLSKIGRDKNLVPYKKFKKATVWLSDNPDRLLLRAEAEVFIGSVFAELQSVEFDKPQLQKD